MDLAEEDFSRKHILDITKNILTLRYYPSLSSTLPKLTWKDFLPNSENISLQDIDKKIEQYLRNHIVILHLQFLSLLVAELILP